MSDKIFTEGEKALGARSFLLQISCLISDVAMVGADPIATVAEIERMAKAFRELYAE